MFEIECCPCMDHTHLRRSLCAQAICTAAQYGGSGQTTAVRKDCHSKVKKTCKQVCADLKLKCLESIHLYGYDGADGVHKRGMRVRVMGVGLWVFERAGSGLWLCERFRVV